MNKQAAIKNPILLPDDVEPVHYNLEIKTDFENFTFSGKEDVSIVTKQPTSKITLHAADLEIKKAYLAAGGKVIHAKKISPNKKKETVTFNFGKKLEGSASLKVEFVGRLNDKMHGFYRTSYTLNGMRKYGAATQFEATDARRAFPCWDEPAKKAKFTVTLIVPNNLTALSNMPVVSEGPYGDSGLKRFTYSTTPVMSTYLLAFVIADLESIESKDRNGIPVRVWTTPGKREQARFSLECALHTLPYFSDWFGIPYSLPKLDMVSLPDFAAGAMENWGLITYRETAMLVDPEKSAVTAKQRVAEVVDHELAHQWFGNLVTMAWWDDLWLNEGFASYMGPKAVDRQFPDWNTWTQYVADDFLVALHKDSLKNTHPVEVPVKNPYEISEIFDAITYRKGSVVNRMIEHYLGEDDFRRGLNVYLNRHAYSNARTEDLWQALEDVSGKPVKAIMASYTKQPGYPVVIVHGKGNGGERVLDLEQKRFRLDGKKDKENLTWKIPVGILTSNTSSPTFTYMEGEKTEVSLKAGDDSWVKLNPSQSGFYRVLYSPELLSRLTGAVESGEIGTVDRLGLLDDVFALSRAGYMKTSEALSVLKAYRNETDFSVWVAISRNLRYLDNLLEGEQWKDSFNAFAKELFRPVAASKGWNKLSKDSHIDVMLRSLALRNLGSYGDKPTIEETKGRFQAFVNGGNLDPDLKNAVYSVVAENGGEDVFERFLRIYNSTDLHEEKNRILSAMGNFSTENILRTVLEFAFSDKVRPQDLPIAINSVGQNPRGRNLAWEFVKKNWETIMERYHEGGLFLIGRIIEGTTTAFTTRDKLQDVKEFFKAHKVPGAKRAIKQSLEVIELNIQVLNRDREDIREWLEKNNYKPTS
ncbi:MAG TPA: M1 family metallopeptidase [Thermodesulfobacteriota bacterium]|nr:M1 family metallopeptidase [Thermodesulfobacteriota bacterium]